jgi:hypothetical protein
MNTTTQYNMTVSFYKLQTQLDDTISKIDRIRTGPEPTRADLDVWGRLIHQRDTLQGKLNHLAGQM